MKTGLQSRQKPVTFRAPTLSRTSVKILGCLNVIISLFLILLFGLCLCPTWQPIPYSYPTETVGKSDFSIHATWITYHSWFDFTGCGYKSCRTLLHVLPILQSLPPSQVKTSPSVPKQPKSTLTVTAHASLLYHHYISAFNIEVFGIRRKDKRFWKASGQQTCH